MSEELREQDALALIVIVAVCATLYFIAWLGAVLQNLPPHLFS